MNTENRSVMRYLLAFLAAVIIAAAWGSIVQTQSNLAVLTALGADVGLATRLGSTLRDLGIFAPFYAAVFVAPALLAAFLLAGFLAGALTGWRAALYVVAGGVGIYAAIPAINWLAPLALLIIATRDLGVVALMAIGGVLAGGLFARLTQPQFVDRRAPHPPHRTRAADVAARSR